MVYLHENREEFTNAVNLASEYFHILPIIAEKDYYVTMILRELSERQNFIVFKGGTSLSKCHKAIKRFSEDIDITIDSKLTQGQMKKLKESIKVIAEQLGLSIPNIDDTRSRRSYNRYILEYQSVLSEPDDAVQTAVLMETSFAEVSFPTVVLPVHVNIWQYLQLGLLVAASQIKTDFQSTIEVNYTIRKEAFACEENLLGQNSKKTLNNYVELYYSKEEQRKIFYECIGNQDPDYLFEPSLAKMDGMEEEAFVGVKTLCHPYNLALSESVFDSIFRHSFDRAHDIQEYGRVLTEHMPEIKKIATVLGRGEKVKELIEETAAELAFNNDPSLASGNVCYYYEKISMLPNFWAQTNNFKRLLSLFDRNLMFIRDVHDVCKKFNGLSRCKGNCKKCDAIHHPFSMLYKLGMLGIIPTSLNREGYVTQEFLDSTKVTYITQKNRGCVLWESCHCHVRDSR